MSIKTALFLIAFVFACGGSLRKPLIGVIGYVALYYLNPTVQWWGQPIAHWGIRYSYLMAVFTGIGIILNYDRLRYGKKILAGQEWLLILFTALALASMILLPLEAKPDGVDHPALKLTKILIFLFMLTHVVTSIKDVRMLFWVFVTGAIFLGYQSYTANPNMFVTGRLNAIGGPDFREANFLAAHMAACLPIIAVQFIISGRIGKAVCLVAGVLSVNTIVLTRSRGALVGLVAGAIVALLAAPKKYRKIVLAGLIAVTIGGYALTDPGYWKRAETITAKEDERGRASQSRIDIWRGSVRMLREHPMGVGAGNFGSRIGRYTQDLSGADAHSTFVRCYSELGAQGILIYLLLILGSMRTIWRVHKDSRELSKPDRNALAWSSYGLGVGLIIFMVCGLTMTTLYVEGPWWFLAMPVCLARALENAKADTARKPSLVRDSKRRRGFK